MASKNVNVDPPREEDPGFYLEQDPVNRLVASMEAITEDVNKTAFEMDDLFRKFIKCAKYQDVQSEDCAQLTEAIDMVQRKLETLKIYVCCTKIMVDTPEA
jgi:hypothetical protein